MVRLDPVSHRYFHSVSGREYISVSHVVGLYRPVFRKQEVAELVARRDGRSSGDVISDWEAIRNAGIDFHLAMNQYLTGRVIDDRLRCYSDAVITLSEYILTMGTMKWDRRSTYSRYESEKVVWDDDTMVAGTIDFVAIRPYSGLIDIWDFKTDRSGIRYTAYGGEMMRGVFDYLENTSYNYYCLKMSIYMLLYSRQYPGSVPGMISLVHVDLDDSMKVRGLTRIPVPYMRMEAEVMVSSFRSVSDDVFIDR